MDLSKQIESYWLNYWNNPRTANKNKPDKKNIKNLNQLRIEIKDIDRQLFPSLKANVSNLRQCSSKQIQEIFKKDFVNNNNQPILGIPGNFPYTSMFVSALKSIKIK